MNQPISNSIYVCFARTTVRRAAVLLQSRLVVGVILAFTLVSAAILIGCLTGGIEVPTQLTSRILSYSFMSNSFGSDAMTDQRSAWWWMSPMTSAVMAFLAVRFTSPEASC
jgi:hypothetical protein